MYSPFYMNALEKFRWPDALGLLSMDCTRPYYSDLGVPPVFGDEFVTELRERIRPVLNDLASADDVAMIHLRDETLAWVEERHGAPCRNALDWWARHIYYFSTSEHAADGRWHDILLGHPEFMERVSPEISRKVMPPVKEFKTKVGEILDHIALDERRPYTEWDQKILALNWSWADGDNSYRPWDNISNTSVQFRFVTTVASLNALLDKSELALLTAAAARFVQPAGVELQDLAVFPYRHPLWPGCGEAFGQKG